MPTSDPARKSSRVVMFAAVFGAIAALHFAREILIPLALAVLLAFLLAPLAGRLERAGLRRGAADIFVVLLAVALLTVMAWVVTAQVNDLAQHLPDYKEEIQRKVRVVRAGIGGSFSGAREAVRSIGRELVSEPETPAGPAPSPVPRVEVVEARHNPLDYIGATVGPILGIASTAFIVVVLVVFMLVSREDLRDRVIRLAGAGHLRVTTQALDDIGRRLSRYLLAQSLVNGSYGLAVGCGLFFIGVPNSALWGLLAGVLRFIPYAGVWMGAAMPIVLALAVFQSWTAPILALLLFVVLDLVTANVLEPWLYGSSAGVSPIAVLVGAIFWTWLWGPAGLLLATPLTVCLAVAGEYVPQLGFLGILLGNKPALDLQTRFYQRVLAGDYAEARAIVAEYSKSRSVSESYDDVLVPALSRLEQDRHGGALDEARLEPIWREIKALSKELGESGREAGEAGSGSAGTLQPAADIRILCLPALDTADEVAAVFLARFLSLRGWAANAASVEALSGEMFDIIQKGKVDIVFVSAMPPAAIMHARYVCKRLRAHFPDIELFIGLWTPKGAVTEADLAEWDPAITLVNSFAESHLEVRRLSNAVLLAGERRKEEVPGAASGNPLPANVKRPLVLVVDDDEDLRVLTRLFVEERGYGTIVGADGTEGLELTRQYLPDLVVTDALMPRLDGREMCRSIKSDPATRHIKVIVATALYRGDKYRDEAFKNFLVDEYITKPVDYEVLGAFLTKYLG